MHCDDNFIQNRPLAHVKSARAAIKLIAILCCTAALVSCASRRGAAPPPPAPAPAAPSVPGAANSWQEYKVRAGQMIMAANPGATFSGAVPDPLASIPVIQIQLNADGTLRSVEVQRVPKFQPQTAQMAVAAIRKAAPNGFGSVRNLPQPWQFSETFLYNDDLKFQLNSLQK
jgi:hypothetical protein